MLYRSRTCAKCGAHVTRDDSVSSRVAVRNESNPMLEGTPGVNRIYRPIIGAQPNEKKSFGSIAVFHGFGELDNNPDNAKNNYAFAGDIKNDTSVDSMHQCINSSKTPVEFIKTSFIEKQDDCFDDNEPTPYATFNLPGFDKESKISDTYETFTAKFAEPPYMLLKKGLDYPAPPQYADSVDYKMRLSRSLAPKLSEDSIYQSAGLSQCHSIASCSSNHEELLRAYEYGKQQKQKLLKLQDEFIESLNENENDETCYRSLTSDRESPTDPG